VPLTSFKGSCVWLATHLQQSAAANFPYPVIWSIGSDGDWGQVAPTSGAISPVFRGLGSESRCATQAMWKSELALLIYLAVLVWTAVAARPLVARYLTAQPPIQWRVVP
jgi:hypothetical protein